MKMTLLASILFSLLSCSNNYFKTYPKHWWQPVKKADLQWWEIGPSSVMASENKVILSKRNELGLLSNFADTPFQFKGDRYPTIEALWQSMKYPEGRGDVRASLKSWPYSREEVAGMQGFPAKKAGDYGTKMMKLLNINWVSFKGEQFIYRTPKKGKHYKIIREAMIEKLRQNPKVRDVLVATGDLELLPDHHTKASDPPAWKYYQIWMEIRDELLK